MLPVPKRDKSGKGAKGGATGFAFKSLYGAPGTKPREPAFDGLGLAGRMSLGHKSAQSAAPAPHPPPVLGEKSFSHHRSHHGAVVAKALSVNSVQPTSPPGKRQACGAVTRGSADDLAFALAGIDGKAYKAYEELRGCWEFKNFRLFVDHVQAYPHGPPSRCRVQVAQSLASIPSWLLANGVRRAALCDYLTRRLREVVEATGGNVKEGHGGPAGDRGGEILVDVPGQNVVERTSVVVNSSHVEARFSVGLPAQAGAVVAEWTTRALTKNLAVHVERALFFNHQDASAVQRHVETVEDAAALRSQLDQMGLVAFVANGSILPRRSGASDKPMDAQDAVRFVSPPSLEVTMNAPHKGKVKGMGIKKGVTVIVGGGFNGKTTLLKAIEMGVYNKVPGDGRELIVTDAGAVKIRAEEGRRVQAVDISPYVSKLPQGEDTTNFKTEDASGSISQSANIQEAYEAGASVLLLDEDTCATNFMIRDERMQALISKDKEPITPFIARIRTLANNKLSTILVTGGSGEYFNVADRVICMESYCPKDVTEDVKRINQLFGESAVLKKWGSRAYPSVVPRGILPTSYYNEPKTSVRGRGLVHFGEESLDLSAVEQLVEVSQTRAIAEAVHYVQSGATQHGPFNRRSLSYILDHIEQDIDRQAHGAADMMGVAGRLSVWLLLL
ncbi:unnamed protein product [Ostreobium quekettii]|uniref:Uncharacterized protein n=1 Tax=Ostreobium quekettii TaxID=121088 RepID=A0A8S1J0M9_9CHLO|nr:unnamed protein product [Ostreobium quekettii]